MKTAMKRRDFIRQTAQACAVLGIGGISLRGNLADSENFDLIIKNGTVIDGLQSKGFRGDLGVVGEKITAIGNLQASKAKLVLDASKRVVSPGFIDIHTHTDATEILINPKGESKIRQGVTLEVGGNCGGSSFPLRPEISEEEKKYTAEFGFARDWTDLEGLLSRVHSQGLAFNYATLVGQGTVRHFVMGDVRRAPTPEEMAEMKELVARAMQQGAFGISSGLEYTPSGFASTEELIELCKAVASYGGFYATHIRSEDRFVVEAVAEAIHIAEAAGLPLQISHFKAVGTTNWWKTPFIIDLLDNAVNRGILATADRYPYTAYSTGLSINFPQWALEGGSEAFVERLKNPAERQKMHDETMEKLKGTPWENILITNLEIEDNKELIGKNLAEAAALRRKDPYVFCCDLLIEEGGDVSIVGFGMSEEDTEVVLRHPRLMVASDGSALAPYGPLSQGLPHPRNYGTFPRFLGHYVREKKTVTLPEAIRKMTYMPAAKLGLEDRGMIKKGTFADLVVFDPETVADRATYTAPEQYPVGIDYVIVHGRVVLDHGQHTGELPGNILYGPGKK